MQAVWCREKNVLIHLNCGIEPEREREKAGETEVKR